MAIIEVHEALSLYHKPVIEISACNRTLASRNQHGRDR